MKKSIILALFIPLLLFGCQTKEDEAIYYGQVENIKELVHQYSTGYYPGQSAFITSSELIISDEKGTKNIYDLPEDEFFVSIAPFIEETHDCYDHSLTGCQGELVGEEFLVYIEDLHGNVMIDEKIKSFANGFIDLWIPRNGTYKIIIEHEGKRVESQFSTFSEDGTCITTLQLL